METRQSANQLTGFNRMTTLALNESRKPIRLFNISFILKIIRRIQLTSVIFMELTKKSKNFFKNQYFSLIWIKFWIDCLNELKVKEKGPSYILNNWCKFQNKTFFWSKNIYISVNTKNTFWDAIFKLSFLHNYRVFA